MTRSNQNKNNNNNKILKVQYSGNVGGKVLAFICYISGTSKFMKVRFLKAHMLYVSYSLA